MITSDIYLRQQYCIKDTLHKDTISELLYLITMATRSSKRKRTANDNQDNLVSDLLDQINGLKNEMKSLDTKRKKDIKDLEEKRKNDLKEMEERYLARDNTANTNNLAENNTVIVSGGNTTTSETAISETTNATCPASTVITCTPVTLTTASIHTPLSSTIVRPPLPVHGQNSSITWPPQQWQYWQPHARPPITSTSAQSAMPSYLAGDSTDFRSSQDDGFNYSQGHTGNYSYQRPNAYAMQPRSSSIMAQQPVPVGNLPQIDIVPENIRKDILSGKDVNLAHFFCQ